MLMTLPVARTIADADQRSRAIAVDQQRLDLIAGDVELPCDPVITFQHGRRAAPLSEQRKDIDRALHQPIDVGGEQRYGAFDIARGGGLIERLDGRTNAAASPARSATGSRSRTPRPDSRYGPGAAPPAYAASLPIDPGIAPIFSTSNGVVW
jgi:hypothetical protein